jgi:hypothetical protein
MKELLAKTPVELTHTFRSTPIHYAKGKEGEEGLKRMIRDKRPISTEILVCVGAKVRICQNLRWGEVEIIQCNKPKKGDYIASNGTLGEIVSLHPGVKTTVGIRLNDGTVFRVGQMNLRVGVDSKGNPEGEYFQVPFAIAFAVTGHSLQGLTINDPMVVCPYGMRNGKPIPVMKQFEGWLGVCISRVTKPELLHFWFGQELEGKARFDFCVRSLHVDKEALAWTEKIMARQGK